MKGKSLFLSAALSAFILMLIGGVVRASANGFFLKTDATTPAAATVAAPTSTDTLGPTATTGLSPAAQKAVDIATAFIRRTDVYSVDTVTVNGMDAYKITFSSGDLVYVTPAGKVIWHILLTQTVYQSQQSSAGGSQSWSSSQGQNSQGEDMSQVAPGATPVHHDDGGGGDDSGGDH